MKYTGWNTLSKETEKKIILVEDLKKSPIHGKIAAEGFFN
jgi:hypothetical protein